jgi:hypothetical protein
LAMACRGTSCARRFPAQGLTVGPGMRPQSTDGSALRFPGLDKPFEGKLLFITALGR